MTQATHIRTVLDFHQLNTHEEVWVNVHTHTAYPHTHALNTYGFIAAHTTHPAVDTRGPLARTGNGASPSRTCWPGRPCQPLATQACASTPREQVTLHRRNAPNEWTRSLLERLVLVMIHRHATPAHVPLLQQKQARHQTPQSGAQTATTNSPRLHRRQTPPARVCVRSMLNIHPGSETNAKAASPLVLHAGVTVSVEASTLYTPPPSAHPSPPRHCCRKGTALVSAPHQP